MHIETILSESVAQEPPTNEELRLKFEQILEEQKVRRAMLNDEKSHREEHLKDPKERIQTIEGVFNKIADKLREDITSLDQQTTLTRECLNALWDALSDLREYFSNISYSMVAYDQKKFKGALQGLENKISDLSTKVPRQKFRFKRRKQQAEAKKTEEVKLSEETMNINGLCNKTNENLVLTQEDLDWNFKVENLENCELRMNGTVKMMWLNNLKNCKVWLAPSENSIMIHGAINCEIYMVGQQIRIHDSYDSTFGVYCNSKLIIESCTRLKFKEYSAEPRLMQESGMVGKENLWREVQDFNWIKVEQSPNFDLVEGGN
jgi:hypothetical protein